jgi:hypothetical protein
VRRLALGCALALAALAAAPALAVAAQVRIVEHDGTEHVVSLSDVEPDVRDRAYTLRDADGGERRVTVTGHSLRAVFEAAGADPARFGYAEIARPEGAGVLLGREQAVGEGAFPEGPPVVWADGSAVRFLRPSAGEGDVNAPDAIAEPSGTLVIRLHRGSPFEVKATASRRKVEVGETVEFMATLTRRGAGEAVTYSWYFDDGHSAEGRRVRHRFTRRGAYDVVVGVRTPTDQVGASAVVTVQVGKPGDGPDRRGGGTNPDASAPDSGVAEGGAGGGPGTGTGSGSGASPGSGTSDTSAGRQARRRRDAEPVEEGQEVVGRVLGELTKPRVATLPRAARTGRPDDDGGSGLPDGALQGLAVLLLLATGWVLEMRRMRVS